MIASELRSLDLTRQFLPIETDHAKVVLDRVGTVVNLPKVPRILDIGCAQGLFLVACAQFGFDSVGVEPDPTARAMGTAVAEENGVNVTVLDGVAEALPVASDSFDIVHAKSVVEHVVDVERVFAEAFRVLRPGGIFWFNTASSMCPRQCEIRGFPGFGWYPDPLKQRIMNWAMEHRPQLIGHTSRPAYHWFTPRKARRMLAAAGFSRVYDRWDLRGANEGGRVYRAVLSFVRKNAATKLVGDILVPGCSYAAVK